MYWSVCFSVVRSSGLLLLRFSHVPDLLHTGSDTSSTWHSIHSITKLLESASSLSPLLSVHLVSWTHRHLSSFHHVDQVCGFPVNDPTLETSTLNSSLPPSSSPSSTSSCPVSSEPVVVVFVCFIFSYFSGYFLKSFCIETHTWKDRILPPCGGLPQDWSHDHFTYLTSFVKKRTGTIQLFSELQPGPSGSVEPRVHLEMKTSP